jgi:hypothetical protein
MHVKTCARTRRAVALASAMAAVAALAPVAAADARPRLERFSIETLSSRADKVTGDDALVEVQVPSNVRVDRARVLRNGADVTASLTPDAADPRRLVGVVGGLRKGLNLLTADGGRGSLLATDALVVVNRAITGPVFSGPHQTPYVCRTAQSGLGDPTDTNCSAPTQTAYFYRSTAGGFKALADPATRPDDLAQTTTRAGETVDYVVRVESGTINRAVYRWAVLADGGQTGKGWNHRLSYQFGGGCGTGYHQGTLAANAVLDDAMLRRGYAVATASLNTFGVSCNDVLSAETMMMVKERVIESLHDAPVWTMGWGGSGGAIQQLMIASNYPGLLDGVVPAATFQDNSFAEPVDCRLLNRYFATGGATMTGAQRLAVTGYRSPATCLAWDSAFANVVVAEAGCDAAVPVELRYNALTNPTGARCTLWDNAVNVFGRDPATGFARRTLDNTGVQYGLKALKEGTISVDRFLDLNDKVGGYDNDGRPRVARAVADPEAVATAYRTGRITQGKGGLPDVPIIDARSYTDTVVDIHTYIHSFIVRERLRKANGNADNQVMWRTAGAGAGPMNEAARETMAAWLDGIAADESAAPKADKVVANKPASAVDACWTTAGQRIDDPAEVDATGPCTQLFPPASTPRLRAGQPLDSLAVKCQLRPVDAAEYGTLTPEQEARLAAVFPDGVCDYTKPGQYQQPLKGTWLSYGT